MANLSAHHFGTTVSDLNDALAFYEGVLGLDVLAEFEVSGDEFSTAIGVNGATGSFAHLDGDGARIELIEYEPTGEDRTGAQVNDTGAKHLGLEVDDVQAFYESLPEDVETISEPRTTASGSSILFLRDPDGNPVEIIEPAES